KDAQTISCSAPNGPTVEKILAWDGSAEPLVQGRWRVVGDGSRARLKPAVNPRIRGFQASACKRFGGTQIGRKGSNGLNISALNLAEYGAVSSTDKPCNRMERALCAFLT